MAKVLYDLAGPPPTPKNLCRKFRARNQARLWSHVNRSRDDPASRWTGANERLALFAYCTNYLIDLKHTVTGRQFAASLGLTPLQRSSGGNERMGRISRMGDRYPRRLLVVGLTSLFRRVVTVAAANRTARVAWAIMKRGGTYRKLTVAAP